MAVLYAVMLLDESYRDFEFVKIYSQIREVTDSRIQIDNVASRGLNMYLHIFLHIQLFITFLDNN